jgi:antitoxin YefM
MAEYISYSKARAELARLCSKVAEDREVVYITRRSKDDVALIASEELSSLLETVHLLRSPKNAQRLLTALNRALSRTESPQTLSDFKRDVGLE